MNTQEIIELEKQYIMQTYKRADFVLERGEGVWLYDTVGRQYLDAGSGIAVNALGHHSEVISQAIKGAAEGLLHTANLYYTVPQTLLARDLCQSCFADKVFFSNSGTEANEGAFKFARKWAKAQGNPTKTGLVAFSGSFHGRTMGALALTSTLKYRTPFEPLIGDTTFGEFNNLDSAKAVINDHTCGVIVEPVQGEGGVTPSSPEFLAGLRELCHRHNALLIFDEIQCGMGRTGTLWAHQDYSVTPDIMTSAKSLGGGLPIGAILVTEAVAQTLQAGEHGSTFAGGPFVCTVAHAVLNHIQRPEFLAEVQAKGAYLAEKLQNLISRTSSIASIRGKGLMWGLVCHIPAAEVMAAAPQHGLLVLVAGEKIVRLLPPLIITEAEIDLLVERLFNTLLWLEGQR